MIIYNITMKVEWTIAEEWLPWMKTMYIPEVLKTGCFEKHQFVRLLQIDETEGPTYAIQFYANNLSNYDAFLLYHSSSISLMLLTKWGKKYIHFDTIMKIID